MIFQPTSWEQVLETLWQEPAGTVLRAPKHWLPHPEDAGATRSLGLPVGQSADFRWRVGSFCAGLHARDFHDHYEAHIDEVNPACDVVDHLRQDAPKAYVAGAAALGALVGLLLGRSKDATLMGAGLGALAGALTVPPDTQNEVSGETAS